jgi:hypothetical protein
MIVLGRPISRGFPDVAPALRHGDLYLGGVLLEPFAEC